MCGIFGFVSLDGSGPDLQRLRTIARVTERRGPHAFGFAWIDGRGRLRAFKQTGRITSHLSLLSMVSDARMMIGHCRFATHGAPENNLNNHPHPCDGGWLVHNGVIRHYDQLAFEFNLPRVTECDSEVLGLLIEELDGSLVSRVLEAAQLCSGGPLATMALWRAPQRLIALTSGGQPLHVGQSKRGTYLASLAEGLPNPQHVEDGTALAFAYRNGRCETSVHAMNASRSLF